jgi:hypothetical protein
MTDTPPEDLSEHLIDFAIRYHPELELMAGEVMLGLGLTPERIGCSDHEFGIRHSAFHPHRLLGGSVSPGGQINLAAGLLNPELLDVVYGRTAGDKWRQARLKTRAEAIIAHEYVEHEGGSHDYAVEHTPDTELPISLAARELALAMRDGWRARRAIPRADSSQFP